MAGSGRPKATKGSEIGFRLGGAAGSILLVVQNGGSDCGVACAAFRCPAPPCSDRRRLFLRARLQPKGRLFFGPLNPVSYPAGLEGVSFSRLFTSSSDGKDRHAMHPMHLADVVCQSA